MNVTNPTPEQLQAMRRVAAKAALNRAKKLNPQRDTVSKPKASPPIKKPLGE